MNHRTRALVVGLLCVAAGLASAQLNQNYRPEFFSPGQGFQSVSAQISNSNGGQFKRQAPAGGGGAADVIPHDQKKQTTFWWVAPDTPFKATKIGGGVQEPPGGAGDGADGGDGGAGGAAGAAGAAAAAGAAGAAGGSSTTQTGFAGQAGFVGATGSTSSVQSSTVGRTIGTQTQTGGAAGGVGAAISGGRTTVSKSSSSTSSTFGRGATGPGIVAGSQQTTSTTSNTQVSTGTAQQGIGTGGVRTTSFVQQSKTSSTTGVAPVPVPQPPPPPSSTSIVSTTTGRRTDTVTTNVNNLPPPNVINTQTNVDTRRTNVATNIYQPGQPGQPGGPSTTTTTQTGVGITSTAIGGNNPTNYGGTTVTRTQENVNGRTDTKVFTTGTNTSPFFKLTKTTAPENIPEGYDYSVPATIPCYEPNKICTPNQYCNGGFVEESQLSLFRAAAESCNSQTEQCCRIRPTPATRCPDDSYVCVAASLCNNGLLNFDAQNAISTRQPSGECYAPEVCCKQQSLLSQSTVLTNEGYVVKDEIPNPANDTPVVLRPTTQRPFQPPPPPQGPTAPAPLPPVGCSAAMNCTEEEYCSSTGVISKTPVLLTEEQKLFRVPVTPCRNLERGFTGVCCRDPDYVDPWPVGQLGQYNPEILGAAFDDGSYKPNNGVNGGNGNGNGNGRRPGEPIQASPSQVTSTQSFAPNSFVSQTAVTRPKAPFVDRGVTAAASFQSTTAQRVNVPVSVPSGLQFTNSGNTRFRPYQNQRSETSTQQCAPRNYNTQPRGAGPLGTGFGEFPWQAMVLLETNKTLLCGGAIISDNTVVTAANCVYGLNPRTIQIKGGEWRLGVDAEPKTFQIVRVKDIVYHPAYNPTNLNYDVAMLVLEDRLRFDTHIGAICLDENDVVPSASYENCVTTGWGKEVLRIHIQNALMQQMSISLLSEAESQSQLLANGFAPESHICGRPSADACEVDVGSALACADTSGTYYLKGVYSADNGCNRADQIVSFSNIDVQWIKQALKNPKQFITPVPNYQTAANSPQVTRVQLQSTQGPGVYNNKYLPPY